MDRTDIHRPSVIDPSKYEFVSFDYFGSNDLGAIMALLEQRKQFQAHMTRTGGKYAVHQNSGTCHICGAHALYVCRWYCSETNEYIMTGEDCAAKLDMHYGNINGFRRDIAHAREAHAGKKKALSLLIEKGIEAAWTLHLAGWPQHSEECKAAPFCMLCDGECTHQKPCTCDVSVRVRAFDQYEERTIRDIVATIIRSGNISDKQVTFVLSLLDKIENRAAVIAQRAAEAEAAAPAPRGRVLITGKVLAIKVQERPTYYHGDSGVDTKMLVQGLTGFKVWGNRFINAEKGDMITFTATVKPSDKDPKFGFFSRATKASFVNQETGEIIPDYPMYQDDQVLTTPELLNAAQAAWSETYQETSAYKIK